MKRNLLLILLSCYNYFYFSNKIDYKNKEILKPFLININQLEYVYKFLNDSTINHEFKFFKDINSMKFLYNFIDSDIFKMFIKNNFSDDNEINIFKDFLTTTKQLKFLFNDFKNDIIYMSFFFIEFNDKYNISFLHIKNNNTNIINKTIFLSMDSFVITINIIISFDNKLYFKLLFLQNQILCLQWEQQNTNNKDIKNKKIETEKIFCDNFNFFINFNTKEINIKNLQYIELIANSLLDKLNKNIISILDEKTKINIIKKINNL